MKWTEVDTAEWWEQKQRSTSARGAAGGKLGKCLREEARWERERIPEELCQGGWRDSEMGWGRQGGGKREAWGEENSRAGTGDPVIKIKHGAERLNRRVNRHCLHRQLQLAFLGTRRARSHMYMIIWMTWIKTSTAWAYVHVLLLLNMQQISPTTSNDIWHREHVM